MRTRLAATAVAALLLAAAPAARADAPAGGADLTAAELTGNTLVWPDAKGAQNLIHFGRFGEFDWYFPCQFESGAWQLGADRMLRLSYVNPQLPPRDYALSRRDATVTLRAADGETLVAELQEGDRLPYF